MPVQKHDKISVIIAAGGMGKRLGYPAPKAFIRLGSKPLLSYSLEVFNQHASVTEIVLVVPASSIKLAQKSITDLRSSKTIKIVEGGEHRWQSVKNGVQAADASIEWVMTHDAARPFVTEEVISSLIGKCSVYKCVITATPVDDTIRLFQNDRCTGTVDRSALIRVGTPQLFHRKTLLEAFTHAQTMNPPPTDEAMLMEKCGVPIGFSWGDPLNFKITTKSDLDMAEAIILARLNR